MKMKNCSNICSICGTDTSKLRFIQVGLPNTTNNLRTEILLLWKRQCIQSLCNVLFESKCPDQFMEYFQQGMYCPDCLQITRDLDLVWKQFIECKRRIKKQSAKVRTLLARSYKNGRNKSEPSVIDIEERISSLQDSSLCDYSAKEVLEMIYTVTHFKRGIKKSVNQTLKTEGCIEYSTGVDIIKGEPTDEYNDNFDSEGDDWLSANTSDDSEEADINNYTILKRGTELEINYPKEIKRPCHTRKFYGINKEEKGDTEPKSDGLQLNDEEEKLPTKKSSIKSTDGQCTIFEPNQKNLPISDNEGRTPSYYSPNKKTIRSEKLLNQKKKTSIRKKAKIIIKSENSETASNSKHKNKTKGIPKPRNLKSDIVLDDSEQVMLQNITRRKQGQRVRLLSKSEFNLVLKIAQYTRDSIRKLDLTAEQLQVMFILKRRVKERDTKTKNKPPKIQFCCKEENCSSKFDIEEQLEGHIREKHKGERLPFYCTTCPKRLPTYNTVKSHREIHHKGIKMCYCYFCKICEKGYKTEDELKSHSESAHQGPNPFRCAFCEVEHLTSWELIRHMNEFHHEEPPEMTKELQKRTCAKCGRYCKTDFGFKKHMAAHEMKSSEKLFKCYKCSKSYASQSALNIHKEEHQRTYIVCDVCGKTIYKENFSSHKVSYSETLKFECKVCNKRFKKSEQLHNHERIHSGIRSFICSVCGKGFYTKLILQGHEKTHEPGYIPRKPFRRTRPNRKKKVEQPSPAEPSSSKSFPASQQGEADNIIRKDIINSSVIVPHPQPQIINYRHYTDMRFVNHPNYPM